MFSTRVSLLNFGISLPFQIPEYCRTMDEAEILDNAFNLLFAFDEVVALGYRESVNLAQIRWACITIELYLKTTEETGNVVQVQWPC